MWKTFQEVTSLEIIFSIRPLPAQRSERQTVFRDTVRGIKSTTLHTVFNPDVTGWVSPPPSYSHSRYTQSSILHISCRYIWSTWDIVDSWLWFWGNFYTMLPYGKFSFNWFFFSVDKFRLISWWLHENNVRIVGKKV